MQEFSLVDMDNGHILDTSDLGNIAEHLMVLDEMGRNARMFEKEDVHRIFNEDGGMTVITSEGGQLEAHVITDELNEIVDIKDARNIWKGFLRNDGVMVQ